MNIETEHNKSQRDSSSISTLARSPFWDVSLWNIWDLGVQALYYFDADVGSELTLSTQLRIRRVKKSEKQSYGQLSGKDHGLGWGFGGPLSFVLECVSQTSRELEATMKRLAISLLLFKHDMGLNNELPWFRLRWGRWGAWESDRLPPLKDADLDYEPMSFPRYRLTLGEVNSFRIFWSVCNQTNWHNTLFVAGKRLLQAQWREEEHVLEDRLIDLMIACEALVLKGEHNKGDNIAHRVGKLQKEQISHLEKRAIDELGLAYKLRNDVVHEGEFSSSNLAQVPFPEEFTRHVEQYLRIGMVNYVDMMNQGQSKTNIIQYLDSLR